MGSGRQAAELGIETEQRLKHLPLQHRLPEGKHWGNTWICVGFHLKVRVKYNQFLVCNIEDTPTFTIA